MRIEPYLIITMFLVGCSESDHVINTEVDVSVSESSEEIVFDNKLQKLKDARYKWSQSAPENYRINLSFSGGEYRFRDDQEVYEMLLIVKNNSLVDVLKSPPDYPFGQYSYFDINSPMVYTIDDIFNLISSKINDLNILGEVSYNSDFGYPEGCEFFDSVSGKVIQFSVNEFYNPETNVAKLQEAKAQLVDSKQEYNLQYSVSWGFSTVSLNHVYSHVLFEETVEKYFIGEHDELSISLNEHPGTLTEIYDLAVLKAKDLYSSFSYSIKEGGYLEFLSDGPYGVNDGTMYLTIGKIE